MSRDSQCNVCEALQARTASSFTETWSPPGGRNENCGIAALCKLDYRSMRPMSWVYYTRLKIHVCNAIETRKPASEHPRGCYTAGILLCLCSSGPCAMAATQLSAFPWLADNYWESRGQRSTSLLLLLCRQSNVQLFVPNVCARLSNIDGCNVHSCLSKG